MSSRSARPLPAVALAAAFLLLGTHCRADEVPSGADAVSVGRRVLALYASSEAPTAQESLLHRAAETVLNHLGLIVDYHDIDSGLPAAASIDPCIGFVTWFQDEKMKGAEAYCDWFAAQVAAGKKAIVLGSLGAFLDDRGRPVPKPAVDRAFAALGLAFHGDWTENPLAIRVVSKDAAMVEFERTLENEANYYQQVVSMNPDAKVYLTLARTDREGSESHAVVVTPTGGFVLPHYAIYQAPATYTRQWRIDPFRFFEEAFALRGLPRMDVSTLNGNRLIYTHVDGDGFRNVSEIDTNKLSAEVILEQVIEKYDLPFTVSVITGDIDPAALGSERTVAVARAILARPNAEAASHSFSHPHNWLTNEADLAEIEDYTFSLAREIDGSVDYMNTHLLPKGKAVAIYLWTGECNPTPEAIARTERLGLLNLNGGDSRFDAEYPSYAHVEPLTRPGRPVQYYATCSNENLYTGKWRGPFFGYRNIIQTWQNTESPRRIRPIHVYYHYYTGQKQAALDALHEAYRWALDRPTAPVYAGDYLRIAQGFFSARIARRADGGWEVTDNGACRTVRFDDSTAHLDMARSSGVVGYGHYQGSLYVYLDDAPKHIVYTTDAKPTAPYVRSADCFISSLRGTPDRLALEARAYRPSSVVLASVRSNMAYTATVQAGDVRRSVRIAPDQSGDLTVTIPAGPTVRVTLEPADESEPGT